MEFKVVQSLSNVRPSKTEEAELSTTPTNGNIKINSPGALRMKLTIKDYVSIVKAQDDDGIAIYAVKGNAGSGKGETPVKRQVGSILSGKSGGSLLFSSENAFRELDGNKENKKIYSISETPVVYTYEGVDREFYKLTLVATEEKVARKPKATKEASAETEKA